MTAVDGDTAVANITFSEVDKFVNYVVEFCDKRPMGFKVTILIDGKYPDVYDTIDCYARTLQYGRCVEVKELDILSNYVKRKIEKCDDIVEIDCYVRNSIQLLNVFDVIVFKVNNT